MDSAGAAVEELKAIKPSISHAAKLNEFAATYGCKLKVAFHWELPSGDKIGETTHAEFTKRSADPVANSLFNGVSVADQMSMIKAMGEVREEKSRALKFKKTEEDVRNMPVMISILCFFVPE
jgi:hypothetical protein